MERSISPGGEIAAQGRFIRNAASTVKPEFLLIWSGYGGCSPDSRASFVAYAAYSSRLAYVESSGSLARKFSNVWVAPLLPMVSRETVVVLLTHCTDLRGVSKERQLSRNPTECSRKPLPYAARAAKPCWRTSQRPAADCAQRPLPARREEFQPCSMPLDKSMCFVLPPRHSA